MKSIKATLNITLILILLIVFSGCEERQGSGTGELSAKGDLSELMKAMDIISVDDLKPAPEFELLSIDGKIVSLNEYRERVVLLSFWATW